MIGKIIGTGVGLALGAGAGYGIYTVAQGVTGACFSANYHSEPSLPPGSTAESIVASHERNASQMAVVSGQCDSEHPIAAALSNVDPYVMLGGVALVGGVLGFIIAGKL